MWLSNLCILDYLNPLASGRLDKCNKGGTHYVHNLNPLASGRLDKYYINGETVTRNLNPLASGRLDALCEPLIKYLKEFKSTSLREARPKDEYNTVVDAKI